MSKVFMTLDGKIYVILDSNVGLEVSENNLIYYDRLSFDTVRKCVMTPAVHRTFNQTPTVVEHIKEYFYCEHDSIKYYSLSAEIVSKALLI